MSLLLKLSQITCLRQKFYNYLTYLVVSVCLAVLADKFF